MKDYFFHYIREIIPQEEKIVVAVSGWPDSMALLWLLQKYYTRKKWSQENICVAHYNHWQREESHDEQLFLEEYCHKNTFYRNIQIPSKWLSETKLRDMRHHFFDEVMKDSQATKLFLGHNITDRIETTILHMVRGSQLQWFLSIKPQTTRKWYTQYRPLLDLPKSSIQTFCDTQKISYFIDTTNYQNITSRNILRNTIFPAVYTLHAGWEKNRYSSWSNLYNQIENLTKESTKDTLSYEEKILYHQPNKYRGATSWVEIPYIYCSERLLYTILSSKKKTYRTQNKLSVVLDFITWRSSWHLFVWWWYIFKTDRSVHCIDGKQDFWKQKIETHKPITHSWLLQFDHHIYTIKPERLLANQKNQLEIRYPKAGDIYKKKPLSKTLITKKIPSFLRNTLPVIAIWKDIVVILD